MALEDEILPGVAEYFDVFVTQRQYRPEAVPFVEQLKALGKTVVGELDDDFWHLHPGQPSAPVLVRQRQAEPQRARGLAEVVQLPHRVDEPLAQILKRFNPKVIVLPNMLAVRALAGAPRTVQGRQAGRRLGGRRAPQGRRRPSGRHDGTDPRQPPQRRVPPGGDEGLPLPPRPEIKILQPVPVEQYPKLLAGFDIGLAPLIDSPFNRCKSDLKYVEYGKVGVPAVFSKVGPYTRSVKHGETGFSPRTPRTG